MTTCEHIKGFPNDLSFMNSMVYGSKYYNKLINSTVLIVGIDSLVVEICKNLIMSGIKKIYIYDPAITEEETFRINSIKNILSNINPHVIEISTTTNNNQDIIISVNRTINETILINSISRFLNNKHIAVFTLVDCDTPIVIFTDAGYNHIVEDTYDNTYNFIQIENLSSDGIIKCTSYHDLQSGDTIRFINMEGKYKEIIEHDWTIDIINSIYIKIRNFKINVKSFEFINGTFYKIPQKLNIYHETFELQINTDYRWKSILEQTIKLKLLPQYIAITASLVAFEAVKLITNKHIPFNQWHILDDSIDIFPKNILIKKNIIIFGHKYLAAELVYNILLLNITDHIIIVGEYSDNDTNLYNNLLTYTINNIKYPVKYTSINKSITHHIFTELNMWLNDCIFIGAVYDIETRKLINEYAIKYSIPYFDGGIEYSLSSVQSIIPFMTESYIDSSDFYFEKSYLQCIINNFPNDIYHCIEWANNKFNDLFCEDNKIKEIISCEDLYNKIILSDIIKIIETFPKDHITTEGLLFWSHGKRFPKIINYDNINEMHLSFANLTIDIINYLSSNKIITNDMKLKWLYYTTNLRASCYHIFNIDYDNINKIIKNIIPVTPIVACYTAGILLNEIYKYLNNKTNYKSFFLNIASNIFISISPKEANMILIGNNKINSWQQFEYNNNSTLNKFKKYYENLFQISIDMIVYETTIIYADFITTNEEKLLNDILEKNNIDISQKIQFTLLSNAVEELPNIIINI
jgi:molybdopterin/thiamine biosynthesis adenylyltransferase